MPLTIRPATVFNKLDVPLEELLARSFPNLDDTDRIRQTFADDIGVDHLTVGAHRKDGAIHFAFPIVVLVGHPLSRVLACLEATG